MRVLSAEAMREVDRCAIEEVGVPSLVLMENAALGIVEVIAELGEEVESVVIFSGPGNNGGDGLAVARHLDARGYDVEVFLVSLGKDLSGDPAVQHDICKAQGISLVEIEDEEDLQDALGLAREADLIVDALFGTGLGRPLEGFVADVVDGLNDLPVPVLAVDLPSGLNGTRANVLGPHVEADLTVTLAALKPATILPPAADAVGDLWVADLGIPPRLLNDVPEEDGRLELLTADELSELLSERDPQAHKGSFGHVVVVAGSPGKSGAVVLALRGAVRSGAGLVTAAVPEPLVDVVDAGSVESMTLGLPAGEAGQITDEAVDRILALLEDKTAVAIGPGLGQEEATFGAIRRLVLEVPVPVVLDADGVNAFAGRAGKLRERPAPTILTPHPGELGRLLGTSSGKIQEDRIHAVREAVRATGAIVLLKGHLSLVGVPSRNSDGAVDVSICPVGNAGMATGGSGDVLTGVVLGLLGQVDDPADAARLGVYVHGLAGDLAAEETGERALAAGDLVGCLVAALRRLEDG